VVCIVICCTKTQDLDAESAEEWGKRGQVKEMGGMKATADWTAARTMLTRWGERGEGHGRLALGVEHAEAMPRSGPSWPSCLFHIQVVFWRLEGGSGPSFQI
jgi:hypothetical protein